MSEIKVEVGQRVLLRNGLVGVVELSPLKHPYRVQDYSLNPNGKFYGDGQECSCDVVEILPPEPPTPAEPTWEIGVWYPCKDAACEGKILEMGLPETGRLVGIVRTFQDHKDWCATTWAKTGENSVLGHSLTPPAPPEPTTPTVEVGKWYPCRNGHFEGKVLDMGLPGEFAIIGIVRGIEDHADWSAERWKANGSCRSDMSKSPFDLMLTPPEPKRHTYEKWANCYPDKAVWLSETRKQADEHANRDRIACVPITIPFVEGEGLP